MSTWNISLIVGSFSAPAMVDVVFSEEFSGSDDS
jgi:hypothetical protein